ncbi:hypothetical protein [Mesorhizobium sp.]|uniref:hypothetical protein n=1 Tax=Mesorhizobium sp. TaxID=1871066 RepID=UPI00257FFF31|nr:hypothetical protein [Mesorhizobium sp.]
MDGQSPLTSDGIVKRRRIDQILSGDIPPGEVGREQGDENERPLQPDHRMIQWLCADFNRVLVIEPALGCGGGCCLNGGTIDLWFNDDETLENRLAQVAWPLDPTLGRRNQDDRSAPFRCRQRSIASEGADFHFGSVREA